jgi:mono/diheme cytochrome c family protein
MSQASQQPLHHSRRTLSATLRQWPFGLALALAVQVCAINTALAADTPAGQMAAWATAAKAADPGFAPSADRGKAFFNKQVGHSTDMPSCAACHTSNPAASGKHAISGKVIAPLSPSANVERFADAAKTEKWFKRNCNDVLGRLCTPAEKADFVSFLITQK